MVKGNSQSPWGKENDMETWHILTRQNTPPRVGPPARIQSGRNHLERGSAMGRTEWSVSSALPQVISKMASYIPGFQVSGNFEFLSRSRLKWHVLCYSSEAYSGAYVVQAGHSEHKARESFKVLSQT
jgi:hypothetical protein